MSLLKKIVCIQIFLLLTVSVSCADTALESLTRQQNYESRRVSSSNKDITRNGDARGVAAGETLVLAELEGPGIITHFWNTIGSRDPFHGRALVIRVYYDGNEYPSVQAPLGDFFGVGNAAMKNYTSQPMTVSSHGRSRTSYWKMPFRKSIKITLSNENPEEKLDSFYYYIDWQKHETLPDDITYFHAEYRQEHPAQQGNYTILETEGHGHYVGTVHSAIHMDTGWYGEGDDFFYIDGEEEPRLKGTGTEDYFNDAWGFREFHTPFHGVTAYEGVLPGDFVTAYRWHIPDPVAFKKSLRVDIEHRGSIFNEQGTITNFELGNFEERKDWVSSVAYWYQYPPQQIKKTIPSHSERIPPYKVIKTSKLPWRANPSFVVIPMEDGIVYAPNTSDAEIEFDFEIDEDGMYKISGAFTFGVMCGVYQPYLDNKAIGNPVDFGIVNFDHKFHPLDTHILKSGKHTLRFKGTGERSAHTRSTGLDLNMFGMVRLILLRLEDMEGYKEVTERLLQK